MRNLSAALIISVSFLSACGNNTDTIQPNETAVQTEPVHHSSAESSDHSHSSPKPTVKAQRHKPEASVKDGASAFKPFDPIDRSTWGEVSKTDGDGNALEFIRILPNGNYQSMTFFGGWKNEKRIAGDGVPGSEFRHWNRPNKDIPIVIVDGTIGPYWAGHLRDAVYKWNKPGVVSVKVATLKPEKRNELLALGNCGSLVSELTNGTILVCDYDFKHNAFMNSKNGGLVVLEFSTDGHIHSGVIHLNNSFKRFVIDPKNPNKARYTREFVMCHEVGHALGVGHAFPPNQSEEENKKESLESCMDYAYDAKPNINPHKRDLQALREIYTHSHDEDLAMGFVCKSENRSTISKTYMHRVLFNGIESIAQTTIKTDKKSNEQSKRRKVVITTHNDNQVQYVWSVADYSNLRQHKQGKTGEFPSLGDHEVEVFDFSNVMPVTFKNTALMLDAKVNSIEAFTEQYTAGVGTKSNNEQCSVLTEKQLGDVDHFFPPKNGSKTGSYATNKLKKEVDGSSVSEGGKLVTLDDYELLYEYVNERKKPPDENLIDPDIRPITRSEAVGP